METTVWVWSPQLNVLSPSVWTAEENANFEGFPPLKECNYTAEFRPLQYGTTKNIVKGGYFLGRNNLNAAKFKSEQLMEENNFENRLFKNLQAHFDLSTLDQRCIEGHMLSKKL